MASAAFKINVCKFCNRQKIESSWNKTIILKKIVHQSQEFYQNRPKLAQIWDWFHKNMSMQDLPIQNDFSSNATDQQHWGYPSNGMRRLRLTINIVQLWRHSNDLKIRSKRIFKLNADYFLMRPNAFQLNQIDWCHRLMTKWLMSFFYAFHKMWSHHADNTCAKFLYLKVRKFQKQIV